MGDEDQRTCRFHDTRERVLEEDTVEGLTFVRLSCGCWQREPRPGEMVFSIDDGYEEVWGTFWSSTDSGLLAWGGDRSAE